MLATPVAVCLLWSTAPRLHAATIHIEPGQSIQSAIGSAIVGDEIVVAPGAYHEAINLLGKSIIVRSAAGMNETILDAAGFAAAITCNTGEMNGSIVEGFTIIGGTKFASTGLVCTKSKPVIRNCRFTNLRKGAIANDHASPLISGCTFDSNYAYAGGAIHNIASNAHIANCSFQANTAVFGGAILNEGEGIPLVINCLFRANEAFMFGGAMMNQHRYSPTVINCTFVENFASAGGAIADTNFALPIFSNCIFWDNAPDVIVDATSSAILLYCDIQDGWNGAGANNFTIDPAFVDPSNGDFHLSAGSPCIDAGYNWAVLADATDLDIDGDTAELTPIDLAGNPRFAAHPSDGGGCGLITVVDIGVFEAPGAESGSMRLGDLDGDQKVDVFDLISLLQSWGVCHTDCCLADLDDSTYIDNFDLQILLMNWGP